MAKEKQKVVIVFAKGDYADQAKKAVLIMLVHEDLIEKIKVDGWILIMQLQLLIDGCGW